MRGLRRTVAISVSGPDPVVVGQIIEDHICQLLAGDAVVVVLDLGAGERVVATLLSRCGAVVIVDHV